MLTLGMGNCAPYASATSSGSVRPAQASLPVSERFWATRWFTLVPVWVTTIMSAAWRRTKSLWLVGPR